MRFVLHLFFLNLFHDGYGCEWIYDYIRKLPIDFDFSNQLLYLSENEMNNSVVNNEYANYMLSQLLVKHIIKDSSYNRK